VYVALACSDRARAQIGTARYLAVQHLLALALPWLGHGRPAMSGLAVVSQTGLVLSSPSTVLAAAAHTLNVCLSSWCCLPDELALQMSYVFVVAVIFVMAFTQAVASELRTREQLDAALRELAAHASQAEELATMRERARLARELHDSLGHTLTTANLHLELLERDLLALGREPARFDDGAGEEARQALATARRVLRSGLTGLRQTVRALHTLPAGAHALESALTMLVQDYRSHALSAEMQIDGSSRTLAAEVALALYRGAQEALTNVVKHAAASHVQVALAYEPSRVVLCVRDDGQGMGERSEEGFGLRGIRERASALGGSLELRNEGGLSLRLTLPH
jgi:signal transduction histidine kinase